MPITKGEKRAARKTKRKYAPKGGTRAGQHARVRAAKGYRGMVKSVAKGRSRHHLGM